VTAKLKFSWLPHIIVLLLVASFVYQDSAFAADEYTRSGKANTSGEMKEFRLSSPPNLSGAANIEVWEDEGCNVEYECWARAKNSRMAKEFTELVEVMLETTNGVVTLTLDTPHDAPWEGTNYAIKITLDIFIPAEIKLVTKTRNFQLDISGPLKSVDIRNSYGEIRLTDVLEETTIDGSYNKVEVGNIRGDVEIETSYNGISVEDVDTEGRKAFLKTSYGKIEVDNFKGQLEASTVYSPIHASNLILLGGANEIKTVYSKIDLQLDEIEDSRLYLSNSYGNIDVIVPEDLSARLALRVGRGGKINTEGILIRPEVIERTRLEGICGEGSSEIEVNISGIGKILVEGR
jgi:DUF4097 and DUF4098 domain-containing protein YvlB